MVTLLEALQVALPLLMFAAWVVGAYEHVMFYRAWRREKIQTIGAYRMMYAAPFAMLDSNLSEQCIAHRRRVLWALVAFISLLALWVATSVSLLNSRPSTGDQQKPPTLGTQQPSVRTADLGRSRRASSTTRSTG